jgi:hypothetical protein
MKNLLGLVLALTTLSGVAAADVMWQPTAVTTNMGFFNGSFLPNNLISQGGLSVGYVSGVTNAGTYTASHNNVLDEWQSTGGPPTGIVTFDLGATVTVTGFRLWNASWNTIGDIDVRDFELLADTDNDFSNGVTSSLGSFVALNSFGNNHAMQSFSATATTTQFVHMRIASNYGAPSNSGFSEAAFTVSAVPEPSSLLTLGALAGGLSLSRRRRTR